MDFKPIYSLADSITSIKEWIDSGGLKEKKLQSEKYGDKVKL